MTVSRIELRPTISTDLPIFFEHQRDREAHRMAAFGAADPTDRAAFDAHWKRITDDADVVVRTMTLDTRVVGHVLGFELFERREVSYWLERALWGRGLATHSLGLFLAEQTLRPMHARAAKDNAASIRVLRKCGFVDCGEGRGFAAARGAQIDEVMLRLDR